MPIIRRQFRLGLAAVVFTFFLVGCQKEPSVNDVVATKAIWAVRDAAPSLPERLGVRDARLFGHGDGPGALSRDSLGSWKGSPWSHLGDAWWPSAWSTDVEPGTANPRTYHATVRFWVGGVSQGKPAHFEHEATVKVSEQKVGEWKTELVRFDDGKELSFGAEMRHWLAVIGLGVLILLSSNVLWLMVRAAGNGFWSALFALAWFGIFGLPMALLTVRGVAVGTYDAFGGSIAAAIVGVIAFSIGGILTSGPLLAAFASKSDA
jgi:hypothetical protein